MITGNKDRDDCVGYRIVFVQTMITNYRTKFFLHVVKQFHEMGVKLVIPTGTTYFYPELKNGYDGIPFVKVIKNMMFLNDRLMFQFLPLRTVVGADLVYFEFNPRILSTWIFVFIRRLLGKRSVGWGHYYSRKGEGSAQNLIRRVLFCLVEEFVTYSERDLKVISRAWPNKKVLVAHNSTNFRSDFAPAPSIVDQCDMVFSGRLIPEKKVDLLLKSFAIASSDNVDLGSLHIVGSGPEDQFLKSMAQEMGIADRVVFHGPVYEMDALREIYRSCFCSVSPGYVGLMAFQSHAHGRPIIVSPDEPHAPEFHMCEDGMNSIFFRSGSSASLADSITDVFQHREQWNLVVRDIQKACLDKYSIEAMAAPFVAFAVDGQARVDL